MKNLLIIFLLIFCFSSCVHQIENVNEEIMQQVDDSCSKNISYSSDIQIIINKTCAISGCHVQNGFKDFSDYTSLRFQLDSRGKDLFISRIQPGGGMPPTYTQGPKSLSDCEKSKLISWINAGYPNN